MQQRKKSLVLVIVFCLGFVAVFTGCQNGGPDYPVKNTIKSFPQNSPTKEDEIEPVDIDISEPEDTRTTFELLFEYGPIPALNEEGLWGYIDSAGTYVINPRFADAFNFTEEGLALVKDEASSNFGFIDITGAYVIEPNFERAYSFSNGLAVVKSGAYQGYIDITGSFAIEPKFIRAYDFKEGLAVVYDYLDSPYVLPEPYYPASLDKGYGYINTDGEYVIPPSYWDASSFSNGIALVTYMRDNTNTGSPDTVYTIDKTGNELNATAFIFPMGSLILDSRALKTSPPWYEGLCLLPLADYSGSVFIDQTGCIVLPEDGSAFERASRFSNDLAVVQDLGSKHLGYINKSGEWVIPPQYIYASSFHDEYAVIGIDRGEQFEYSSGIFYPVFTPQVIDKSGNIVFDLPGGNRMLVNNLSVTIPSETGFSLVTGGFSSSGLYLATKNDSVSSLKGFVDLDGNTIIDFQFDEAHSFTADRSCAKANINGLWGYINDMGEWLIPPVFQEIK